MKNYEIIQNDEKAIVIKINTAAYKACFFTGRPPEEHLHKGNPGYTLAFNANYSWLGHAIGLLRDNGKTRTTIPYVLASRPALEFNNLNRASISYDNGVLDPRDYSFSAFEGGPTLLRGGENVVQQSIKSERFQADAVRRCSHVSVGITGARKLIVAYTVKSSLGEIAGMLKALGCMEAMKMDGGHMAMLEFHADGVHISRGNSGKVVAGVCLI